MNGQCGWQPAWRDSAPKATIIRSNYFFPASAADEMVAIGREIEASVLSRAVRRYAEHRIFENGHKTVLL